MSNPNYSPVYYLEEINSNNLYIKRDDLIPYSFGGNKARKAVLFFEEIDSGDFDCVVTYGSSHSNHCRIVSNMAAERNMPCYLVGPEEVSDSTFNSKFMDLFGAKIITVPVDQVHDTIEALIDTLKVKGKKPYFIPGGGHGNLGTKAYVQCYEEIRKFEVERGVFFDYVFFATGTGTTHSGLVCGQIMNNDNRKVVGISIARKNPRGRDTVINSICDYLDYVGYRMDSMECEIDKHTIFIDEYVGNGYGKENNDINEVIKTSMIRYGIPMDSTYIGKAFLGMKKYLSKEGIKGKNILFIHTGGTPLFFDDLGRM